MTPAPYGTWKSPISSDLIVKGAIGLSSPSLLQNGICWMESRPQEGGRSVLVEQDQDGNVRDVTCLLYTSPSPRDVEESRMPSSA